QLRVLASARVDRERLAAERAGDLVGVESRGVDHGSRENRFPPVTQQHAVAIAIGADNTGAGQEYDAARLAVAEQRLQQLLRIDDAGLWREERRHGADVRFAT